MDRSELVPPAGEEHDAEGRLITAEFPDFFLVTAYVPNSGRKLVTLNKRLGWDPLFRWTQWRKEFYSGR